MRATYLSVEQAAQLLERSVDHVWDLLAVGVLPAGQIPGNGLVIPLGVLPFSRVSEHEL